MNIKDICSIAERLKKTYKTDDPFILAEKLGIRLAFENYPEGLYGMFQYHKRTRSIYINVNMSRIEQRIVCGHELGHALLHRKYNCVFLSTRSSKSCSFEHQANVFCAKLLLDDIDALQDFSMDEMTTFLMQTK